MSTTEQVADTVPIRIEKPGDRPRKVGREKLCATCGLPFTLEPGQKFFDCPSCYQVKRAEFLPKKKPGAQVLVQIHCPECGTEEFVDFVPDDPATVLCGACFSKRAREQRR